MEKDLIFLGETGITETQANRIADFAKLAYTELETELNHISFFDTSIETINGTNKKYLSYGLRTVDGIASNIERIGKLKSLCAWLREEIQAHQNLINEGKRLRIEDYVEKFGYVLPNAPKRDDDMTEADVLALFDIKKRNHYYELEAKAASIGQFIHKNGAIDSARKTYYEKISSPHNIANGCNDTIIYSYEPSISKEQVEELFYTLQQKHTKIQKELNSIKSEIKSRIANDGIDKQKAYNEAYEKYSNEYQKCYNDYNLWKQSEQKRISALKIVIPNSLKEIYDEIANLGKHN